MSPNELRQQFDREHASAENPPMRGGELIYYVDGATRLPAKMGGCDIFQPPAEPDSRINKGENHRRIVNKLKNIARYWDLRADLADSQLEEKKRQVLEFGHLLKSEVIPAHQQKYHNGKIRSVPEQIKSIPLSQGETLKELKRLRKIARQMEKQYNEATENYERHVRPQQFAPQVSTHDPQREDFLKTVKAI